MPHRIREAVLDEILLEELRRITYTARTKERQFAEFINKVSSTENRRELNANQRPCTDRCRRSGAQTSGNEVERSRTGRRSVRVPRRIFRK